MHAEQKLSRHGERERERKRERERDVCARTEQKLSRQTERERESCVCTCWEPKTSRSSTGDSRGLNKVWPLYFRGKTVAKGVCNVAKLATLCISISPTTG